MASENRYRGGAAACRHVVSTCTRVFDVKTSRRRRPRVFFVYFPPFTRTPIVGSRRHAKPVKWSFLVDSLRPVDRAGRLCRRRRRPNTDSSVFYATDEKRYSARNLRTTTFIRVFTLNSRRYRLDRGPGRDRVRPPGRLNRFYESFRVRSTPSRTRAARHRTLNAREHWTSPRASRETFPIRFFETAATRAHRSRTIV